MKAFFDRSIKGLISRCEDILEMLSLILNDKCNSTIPLVGVTTLKGDYHRYIAEAIFQVPNKIHLSLREKHQKLCQEYYNVALQTATGTIDNDSPLKIRLVVSICHMTYILHDEKQKAVDMAT
jgi:hypothetical protein